MSEAQNNRISEFEKAMNELEALVERMESGELSLEQSLEQFERGVRLSRECQAALKAAELKIETLLNHNGEERLIPVDPGEDDASH